MPNLNKLCMVSRIPGVAGPASFQRRLAQGLAARGIEVGYRLSDADCDAILVIGGTRSLRELLRARRRGVRIVQRLNGMNWIHRRRRTGAVHFLRAEVNNFLLRLIRRRLAHAVVYQSRFAQAWWERAQGRAPVPSSVIYNAVPLDVYSPDGPGAPPQGSVQILLIEGNLAGGYDIGLDWAVGLVQELGRKTGLKVGLSVAGRIEESLRSRWASASVSIRWLGLVPPEEIPGLNRSAHLLYSADVNPACPNSVIEALACGTPVVAFDTGSLAELVSESSGRLAPYGGDPWKLDPPDVAGLAEAAAHVLDARAELSAGARLRAEAAFDVERMVERYVQVLEG